MNTETHVSFWIAFNIGVLILLVLDLCVLHNKAREISAREAVLTSAVWITLSLLFCALVWQWKGPTKGLEFLTGYLIEYSLSVDNIFIFVLIFGYFKVPKELQHRVLFWGVLGALIMRGTMIGVGVILVKQFHWILYLFGVFLVFTGTKMLFSKQDDEVDIENNRLLKFCRSIFRITPNYEGKHFLVKRDGKFWFTPLALVLLMVESTDLMFAVDSIPAIFAVTNDPFIIYTSNVCAILGLRSLYFLLARVVHKFVFLKAGLAIVLTFIGIKMLLMDIYKIPTVISLTVVGSVLIMSVVTSMVVSRWIEKRGSQSLEEPPPSGPVDP